MPACYFDVDGTLVSTNLVHPTLFYMVNQPNPLFSLRKLGRAAFSAPRLAWAELRDRRFFNELLFSIYEGVSEDRLMLLADEVVDKVLKPALYKGSRELIARCRDNGDDVVLVSGALDVHMHLFAKEVGATDIIANKLEVKDGYCTGKLVRPVVAGPEKAVLVREHARQKGYDLADCFAYSDSYSDIPMLSVVGHPAVVNPDGKLENLAKIYSWPILHLDRKN
jgi:HAD superfamily hydrolase (TIGR01490 family)